VRIHPDAAALAALLLTACGGATAPAPAPIGSHDVLLTIGGIDIRYGEVEPALAQLREVYPEAGRQTAVQKILDEYLVDVRLAERAFPEQRAQARQLAQDLCDVATNAGELDRATQNVPTSERGRYARNTPKLPVAVFLFDRLTTGAVSGPIAVPRGYIVAAAHEYIAAAAAAHDLVDATQVDYFTHTIREWEAWIQQEHARLADQVTYVHPDFRDALPLWCRRP
jgi:hypothetical protein